MPGFLVHVGAVAACTHQGRVSVVPGNPRVLVGGQPAATVADTYMVAGCAFTVGTKPQPCLTLRWVAPATRVLIGGAPAVLQTSTGLGLSAEQIPQGPPSVTACQTRVVGQ